MQDVLNRCTRTHTYDHFKRHLYVFRFCILYVVNPPALPLLVPVTIENSKILYSTLSIYLGRLINGGGVTDL